MLFLGATSDDESSHTERPESNQTLQPVDTLQKVGSSIKFYIIILTITTIMAAIILLL